MTKERELKFGKDNIIKELAFLGVDFRSFGKGYTEADLNFILENSILGIRLGHDVNYLVFKSAERSAFKKGLDKAKILTLVDLDGVLVSPIHIAGKLLSKKVFYTKPIKTIKDTGRIKFSNLSWLSKVTKASDETYLWTSRINPSDEDLAINPIMRYFYHHAQDTIDYFPFMGQSTITNLEKKIGKDKLVVVPGKSTQNSKETVIKSSISRINNDNWDLIYFIGSSYFDRRIALRIAQNIRPSNKLIVFDAGHLIL